MGGGGAGRPQVGPEQSSDRGCEKVLSMRQVFVFVDDIFRLCFCDFIFKYFMTITIALIVLMIY